MRKDCKERERETERERENTIFFSLVIWIVGTWWVTSRGKIRTSWEKQSQFFFAKNKKMFSSLLTLSWRSLVADGLKTLWLNYIDFLFRYVLDWHGLLGKTKKLRSTGHTNKKKCESVDGAVQCSQGSVGIFNYGSKRRENRPLPSPPKCLWGCNKIQGMTSQTQWIGTSIWKCVVDEFQKITVVIGPPHLAKW